MSGESVISQDNLIGPPERLHPLYLVTGLGRTLRSAWGIAVGGVWLAAKGNALLAIGVVGAYVAVSLASLVVKWLKLEYRVGRDELRIESGLFSKTSRVIPFDRVTDIDIEQGPIHRLLGLARVRLETGAASSSTKEEGVLDTIALSRAEALREYVRARRRGDVDGAAAAAPVEGGRDQLIFAMNGERVLIAGIFNFSLAIVAGLFGATQTLGDVIGFDPFKRSFWEGMFARSGPVRDIIIAHQMASAIAGAILLILIGLATGIIRTVFREYGFRLDRTETGFRRRRGLVTLTDVSIPAKRVQAAIRATGPIRRHFGWWTLKLQSLAQDGGQGDHVVAPLAHVDEAAVIEASIDLPDAPRDNHWTPIARGYIYSIAPILLPALLLAAGGFTLGQPWSVLAIPAALTTIALRIWNWRNTRYALSGRHLFIERGWWRHQRLILPIRKIQSIDIYENFWSRRFNFCRLDLGVAGGSSMSVHGIPALARVDAERLRAQLLGYE
nr:PH domain-containing protein [uncultured Sphingomonas sp.]